MKKITLIILILFFGLFSATSFAAEITVFGPEKYIKVEEPPLVSEEGAFLEEDVPTIYTTSFRAIEGTGQLVVINGDDKIKHRISSAEI